MFDANPLTLLVLLALFGIILALFLLVTQSRNKFRLPVYILVFTPLLVKIGIYHNVYLHPSFVLILSYCLFLLLYLLLNKQFLHSAKVLVQTNSASLVAILVLLCVFIYGVVVAFIRTGTIDFQEVSRLMLYATGFLLFPIILITLQIEKNRRQEHLPVWEIAYIFVILIDIFSLVGLIPVINYVSEGGVLANWRYSTSSMVVGVLGQYLGFGGINQISSGASGNAGFIINFAFFVATVFIVTRWKVMDSLQKSILVLSLPILFCASILTISRSSYITFALGVAVFVWLAVKSIRIKVLIFLTMLVVVLAAVAYFPDFGPVRKVLRSVSFESGQVQLDASLRGRLLVWQRSIDIVTESPSNAIFGKGAINVRENYNFSTHSIFFRLFVEFGLLGILSFLLIWYGWFRDLFILYKKQKKADSITLLLLPLIMITPGWFIGNLIIGGALFSIELIVVLYGMLAVVFSYSNMESKES